MNKTIGILAHVDAGKTTFSEQILYQAGSVRNLGRVDERTSCLDTDEIERKRGITIFADQAVFHYGEDTYYLIDTPGHVDFSAETERAIAALDYAIVLISGTSGVQAHTTTLFRLLSTYRIPTFFFINKADMEGYDPDTVLDDIKNKLTKDILFINTTIDINSNNKKLDHSETPLTINSGSKLVPIAEYIAERDEEFLEAFLEEKVTSELIGRKLVELIKQQECFPVMSGSALKGIGIEQFLEMFAKLTLTSYHEADQLPFRGSVYKIRHDEKGNRLTFIKALEGRLKVKDEFVFGDAEETIREKVNEIRIYNGIKYESRDEVKAGEVFAVTGLKTPVCGTKLETGIPIKKEKGHYYVVPALQSRVRIEDGTNLSTCIEKLRILEEEDPMLSVILREDTKEILINVMGKIQLEVLEQLVENRFGIKITFEKPKVQYMETIREPVVGYGHFEPLRHYAEVQLRLEPTERGSGITFASECHVDQLSLNFQRVIETHVFEKTHKGVVTGSPITDIRIVLQKGLAHIKHTEGGDFREATYRAIRQGLEKAEAILLEPFYRFEIYVEETFLGRVMSDIQKMRGSFEPPEQSGALVYIRGRGPVEAFMDYSMELVSFTKGTGSISLIFEGYDLCQNAEEVIKEIGYDKIRDMENTSSSVFCAKGTSFVVPWDEAEEYMHTI